MLGTGHWLSPAIRGDYSAQYLKPGTTFLGSPAISACTPTEATGLMLAGASKFWGARVEMRNFVLGHLMPTWASS